jgi:hypothetical protein
MVPHQLFGKTVGEHLAGKEQAVGIVHHPLEVQSVVYAQGMAASVKRFGQSSMQTLVRAQRGFAISVKEAMGGQRRKLGNMYDSERAQPLYGGWLETQGCNF